MNREFLLNILFLLLVNLLIKPFYIFGIELTIQNEVGKAEYGLYFTLFNFTLVLQIVNDLGIQYFNNRHISQHPQLLGKYFPPMLVTKGLLGIFYFFLILVIGWLLGYQAYFYGLLLPLAFNQLLSSLLLFLRSNVSGLAMYRTDSLLSILDKSLLIIICLVLFQIAPVFRIEWFVYAQTSSLLATVIIAFFSFYKRLIPIRFRVNWALVKLILKESFPYALTVLVMSAYSRLDVVLIERLLPNGQAEAGVYASAYRLLDAANMLGFLFASLLLPMFARLLKERQGAGTLLQFSFQLILAGAIPVVVAIIFFRYHIMNALYTEATVESGDILALLMGSFLAYCSIYIYGSLLTANRNLLQINRLFTAAFMLNVTLNYFIIPYYFAVGAAGVALFTQFFVAVGQMIFVHRKLQISFSGKMLLRIVSFTTFVIFSNYFIYNYLNSDWILKLILAVLIGLISALLFQLIDWKAVGELWRPSEKK